jgi:hypothetical protein
VSGSKYGSRARMRMVCRKKRRHPSRGAAEAHKRGIQKLFGDLAALNLYVYCCPICHKWHIGHGVSEDIPDHSGSEETPAPDGGKRAPRRRRGGRRSVGSQDAEPPSPAQPSNP